MTTLAVMLHGGVFQYDKNLHKHTVILYLMREVGVNQSSQTADVDLLP